MGILLMNIVSFSMPSDAYVNPAAYGGADAADAASWAVMFVLVDSKMRGLFTILFGASMLLIYERAEAAGEDGARVHRRRMGWLLVFGLLHYFLIWWGDILTLYALCGLAGMSLLLFDAGELRRTAIWAIGGNFVLLAGLMATLYWQAMPAFDPEAVLAELELYRGGYTGILFDRFGENLFDPLELILVSGPETIGLMAIGMILMKNGFLTGEWESARYRALMWRAYAIGIPGSIALAAWVWSTRFEGLATLGAFLAWSLPFRIATMLGHAALAMLAIRRFAGGALLLRIEAAGQAAFSNYLGTSILMSLLFNGYGFGWFGHLSRWQAYCVAPAMWIAMLLWSKPWLDRFRYGPFEWAWRSLARGHLQKMRLQ